MSAPERAAEAMFSPEAKQVFDMTPRERAAQIAATALNEQITRHRVDGIEAFLSRPFLGKLKWLVLGK